MYACKTKHISVYYKLSRLLKLKEKEEVQICIVYSEIKIVY